MKKLILLLIGLIINSVLLYSTDINIAYERLDISFNGICVSPEIVIAYGSGGMILYSTDKGASWHSKKIVEDSISIQKVYWKDNRFYGICNRKYFLVSEDGINWRKNETEEDSVIEFAMNEDYYFVLSKTLVGFSLNIYSRLYQSVKIISLDTNIIPKLLLLRNNIVLGTTKSRLLFFDIRKDFEQHEMDISQFGDKVAPLDITSAGFFAITNNGYLVEINGIDSIKKVHKVKNSVFGLFYSYKVWRDTLFSLTYSFPTKFGFALPWIKFQYFHFEDSVFKSRNEKEQPNRFMNHQAFLRSMKFDFLDDTTIVAVADLRTIFLSRNSGKSWMLCSHFPGASVYARVQNYLLASGFQHYILFSSDKGVTWLPQKYNDTLDYYYTLQNYNIVYIDSLGNGFLLSSSSVNFEDTLKDYSFIKVKNFGEDLSKTNRDRAIPIVAGEINYVKIGNKFLLHSISINSLLNNVSPSSFIYLFDADYNLEEYIAFQTEKLHYVSTGGDNKLIGYFWDGDYTNYKGDLLGRGKEYKNVRSWISISTDYGRTWTKIADVDINHFPLRKIVPANNGIIVSGFTNDTNLHTTTFNSDYLEFSNYRTYNIWRISFPDTLRDILLPTILFSNNGNVFSYNDSDHSLYFSPDNLQSLKNWVRLALFDELPEKIPFFYNSEPNNDLRFFSMFDIYTFGYNYYKMMINYTLDINPEPRDVCNDSYVLRPYPQPATSMVRFQIYIADASPNPNNIQIFDVYGNEMSSFGNIVVERVSPSVFDFIWNITNVPSGIYFIRYGVMGNVLPVVISR